MAVQRRMKIDHDDVFPAGAFMKGEVSPVDDFDADRDAAGNRPQLRDKESGLPVWQVVVLDADADAGKRDTAVTVKILAKVQPVPPENKSGMPFRPVEFVGLTALPYIDESGMRPRIAWSFRADDMQAPSRGGQQGSGKGAA